MASGALCPTTFVSINFRTMRQLLFRFLSVLILVFLVLQFSLYAASPIQERADRFLALANAGYQALFESTARRNGMR